jgi:hypothetical protein
MPDLTPDMRKMQMAKTIWRYPVEVIDEQVVTVPAGAKILTIATQGETPCLWVELTLPGKVWDDGEHRTIRIFGTGHPMPDDPGVYIGSFMLKGGVLVFHAYDATYSMPTDA